MGQFFCISSASWSLLSENTKERWWTLDLNRCYKMPVPVDSFDTDQIHDLVDSLLVCFVRGHLINRSELMFIGSWSTHWPFEDTIHGVMITGVLFTPPFFLPSRLAGPISGSKATYWVRSSTLHQRTFPAEIIEEMEKHMGILLKTNSHYAKKPNVVHT